ncbi:MAG TPA: protein kinase [Polyangiaceae bacterium]
MLPDPRPRHEAPPAPAAPGEIIGGRYQVGECIGFGGMGIVCAATHLELERPLAIKFVRPEFAQSSEFVARFLNEARAAAALRSEHVAQVLDCGRLPSGTPYMVLERLEGADVERIVGRQGPLPVDMAVDLALQLCEALAEAHAMHIVHRDIKPQNLFLIEGPAGTPMLKVLDFGVSKRLFTEDPSVTHTSHGVGSPHYMSPEQMTAPADVDARTDMWSVGAVLFEMLAGRPPFTGETLPEICAKVVTQPAPFIRSFRPNVPPRLEAVVQRCLEKDRDQRFSDVGELAEALAPFASPAGVASIGIVLRALGRDAGRRSMAAVVVVEDEHSSRSRGRHHIPGVRRSRLPLILTIGLLGGATIFGAVQLLGGSVQLRNLSASDPPALDAGTGQHTADGGSSTTAPPAVPGEKLGAREAGAPQDERPRSAGEPSAASAGSAGDTPEPPKKRARRTDAGSRQGAGPRDLPLNPSDPRDLDPPGIGDIPVPVQPPDMDPYPPSSEP